MSNFVSRKQELNLAWLRIMPYAAFGAIAFSVTSAANLNNILTVYLVLLEAKLGIVLIYFLVSQLTKRARKKQSRQSEQTTF